MSGICDDETKEVRNYMSDTKEKNTTGRKPGKLSLSKKVESSRVKQNFTGGRSKTVTVEVRKTRNFSRTESGNIVEMPKGAQKVPESTNMAAPNQSDKVEGILSKEEQEKRRQVLERAQAAQEDEKARREDEQRRREEREAKRREEREAKEATAAVPETPLPTEALVSDDVAKSDAARKDKKKVRRSDDDFDDNPDELALGKADSRKKVKRARVRDDDDVDYEALDPTAILASEEMDDTEAALLDDDGLGFEDYEEDEEVDDEESIVAVTTSEPTAATDAVRQIKSSQRVIVAAADPEKIKKYLRSEAPSPKVRSRRDQVRAEMDTNMSAAGEKKTIGTPKKRRRGPIEPDHKMVREIIIPETIMVSELANRMAIRAVDVIKELMKMGVMATQNQAIDADTAELLVTELGHKPVRVTDEDHENAVFDEREEDDAASLQPRPPVVTVMGHVDHGKTSLLDALRSTDVVTGEHGGITQHIGAYQVTVESGDKITFIDTPGHEAFTAMRSRGASVTDVVVLVVAADDGIKEQTVEAINHAKAAEVPIVVAVNKIDKPEADSQRVRNELMTHELVPEDFGGDIMCVDVSAKSGEGLNKLVDAILLQSEVLELKANPNRRARGVVIESRMEKGRGIVASLLVQKGTLRVGDIVVAGKGYGRIKALIDDRNRNLDEAPPALAVEVLGFNEAPEAGEAFVATETEREAREVTDLRKKRELAARSTVAGKVSLETLFSEGGVANVKEVPFIIKADVNGSLEAISGSLAKIESDEIKVHVIHSGVGAITESDIALAAASQAIILGFNVRANAQAKENAQNEGVDIRYYSVIYDLVDDVKQALAGMLSPEYKENFLGYAEIRQVFSVSKVGKVGGSMVTDGLIKRGAKVRLLRDNVVIHEGALKTLKRFKDDVKEVREGFECGIAFENYDDIKEGDVVECFEIEELQRSL